MAPLRGDLASGILASLRTMASCMRPLYPRDLRTLVPKTMPGMAFGTRVSTMASIRTLWAMLSGIWNMFWCRVVQ